MAKEENNAIIEEIKPIILTDEETGSKYTLEFSRASVKFAENRGFDFGNIRPMTGVYDLFFYSFRKNHPNVARNKTDKMIDDWGGPGGMPEGMIDRLIALYGAPFEATTDPNSKNSKMTVEM